MLFYKFNFLIYSFPSSKKYTTPNASIPIFDGLFNLLNPNGPSKNPAEPHIPATTSVYCVLRVIFLIQ